MTRARTYPAYRASDVPWVDRVPSGWETLPLYSVLRECGDPNLGLKEQNLLSLSYGRVIRKDIQGVDGLLPGSFETYQIVSPDDLVFRFTDLQNDKKSLRSALVGERGIITSAYLAVRPKGVDARYAAYLMRSYDSCKVFYGLGGGVRQSLKFDDVKRLPVLKPSLAEQRQIADFLDRETARIDTLIEKQQQLIETLRERRLTVVQQAVSAGHAGHRIKHAGDVLLGKMLDAGKVIRPTDTVMPYVRAADVLRNGTINLDALNQMPFSSVEAARLTLDADDVLVIEGGATVGRPGHLREAAPGVAFQKTANRVRATDGNVGRYLYWALAARYESGFYSAFYDTVSFLHLTAEKLREIPVHLPVPDEQRQIADYLDDQTSKIDVLIEKAQRFIELSNERRSALISAAVTGQIDVRDTSTEGAA